MLRENGEAWYTCLGGMKVKKGICLFLSICLLQAIVPSVAVADEPQVINVKDYGAVGDGVTNDTSAMLSALRAANAGDTLYFPKGEYVLRNRIELKDRMRLTGDGVDKTVLRWESLPIWSSFIYGGGWNDRPENPRGMEICNLTVDGDNILSANSKGLLFHNTDHIYIHDIVVQNIQLEESGTNALHFGLNVDDSRIENCEFYNIGVHAKRGEEIPDTVYDGSEPWGTAITVSWESDRNTLQNNYIENTSRAGITSNDHATELIIRGNIIRNTAKYSVYANGSRGCLGLGIELWGGCDNSVIEDNDVDQWISIVRTDRVAVRRNRVEETEKIPGEDLEYYKGYGFEISTTNSIFTDNYSGKGHDTGLSLLGSGENDTYAAPAQYNYFGNNVFTDSMQWAMQTYGQPYGETKNLGVDHNYFYKTDFVNSRTDILSPHISYPSAAGVGARFLGNTRYMTFEECKFSGGRQGIEFCGSEGLDYYYFSNCEVKDNVRSANHPADMWPSEAITRVYRDPSTEKGFSGLEFENLILSGNERNVVPQNVSFGNELPEAYFTYMGNQTGETIEFFDASSDPDGEIANYLWDFGDGLPETAQNPTHVYEKEGDYTVTLVVWDDFGRAARYTEVLHITAKAGGRLGDINRDGSVTVKDVTLLRRWITGNKISAEQQKIADIDGDRKVTGKDVTVLRRKIVVGEF